MLSIAVGCCVSWLEAEVVCRSLQPLASEAQPLRLCERDAGER